MNALWVIGSTIIKMLYGVVIYKYITVTYGIESLGVAGQLLSLMSILLILSNAGIDRGIIRSYSRNIDNPEKTQLLNKASTIISIFSSIVLFLFLILTAKSISFFVFGTEEYKYLVYFLSAMPFFMGLNNTIMSIGIAYGKSKLISQSTTVALIFGMAGILYLGGISFETLLTLVAAQSLLLSISLLLINHKIIRSHINAHWTNETWIEIKKLLSFSFVIIIPVIMMQLTLIINRIYIKKGFGEYQLGLWESVIKLQEGYIQIAGVLLIYFMLPQSSKNTIKAYQISKKYIAITFLIFLSAMLTVSIFGENILSIVYNEEASIMATNLLIFTISDMLRSIYIVNQYLLLAIAEIRLFLVLEFITYSSSIGYVWYVSEYGYFDNLFYGYLIQSIVLSTISFFIIKWKKTNA